MSAAQEAGPDPVDEWDGVRWARILARYRDPSPLRSALEVGLTVIPFLGLWALAWMSLSVSIWLALALSVPIAGFLVRLFVIQHDCGHGSLFRNRALSDWIGRLLGVLTLTPYDVWKRSHAVHHASAGNLDRRGIGDVMTLTVAEYRAMSPSGRWRYRLYRNPFVMFGVGPAWLFLVQNRLPADPMKAARPVWISALGTNLALIILLGGLLATGGLAPILAIWLPSTLLAASIGVWLFYVQHQFEETSWESEADWGLHDSALHGSSNYILPPILSWFSGNIGAHHVHHLQSRVPFYRLPEVLRDHAVLKDAQRLTLRESLACVRLKLWDGERRRLVSFSESEIN
ncbi:fatty acid desaturase [Wenxinia saemankumensis]|uniref:Omega-6 fatty acid desaturase (Delta-12 desaturase) n=1 Tax=Wenxinia saemankumensis TaxID=1447782 RepID=A0A1M6B621_9RHOB|nr:fatty acid desaturase [Wenxinia saemankumensis]SHI44181.1 omega-6 fatty acid desaturase (delta-12 desaturase) [Wenxinia saemankumensis]